jgi:predicted transposase/invertase (TIGR01784 family)
MKLFNLFRSPGDKNYLPGDYRPDITTDLVFKMVFSGTSRESTEALISLLSSCIHRQVSSVRILNSESLPEYLGAKTVRFDILAEFNDGEKADIEMQLTGSKETVRKRSAYYAAKLLAGQPRDGEDYRDIKRVYQIFFLDFNLVPESTKSPRRYGFREETEQDLLTEMVEIAIYEIPKLAETVKLWFNKGVRFEDLRSEERWCIYFLCKAERDMEPAVRELCRVEEGIMKAEKALGKVSWSVKRWAKKYMKEKREMDRRSILNEMKELAHAEAVAEARAEVAAEVRAEVVAEREAAEKEEIREIARNFKALDVSVEKIVSATGLSVEEIEEL